MRITADFPGGNIRFLRTEGDTVYLANDLRDTEGDWFYWCFKAEGAQGKTLTFTFGEHDYVSYWGAAVSRDGENWTWSGRETAKPNGFTYTFAPKKK